MPVLLFIIKKLCTPRQRIPWRILLYPILDLTRYDSCSRRGVFDTGLSNSTTTNREESQPKSVWNLSNPNLIEEEYQILEKALSHNRISFINRPKLTLNVKYLVTS